MAELAIHLHLQGHRPSFDPSAGPLSARVEVEGGTDAYLIDVERGRCRLAAIPGPGLGKWTSAAGLLMLARAGWAGCRAFEDHLPRPGTPADFPRTRTPEAAVKASDRIAASRALMAVAKRFAGLALDIRSALLTFEGEPWAQTLVLQSRRLASDCEERAVDLGRAPREEDRPLIAAIEARANITNRDIAADADPIREPVVGSRPVAPAVAFDPITFEVLDRGPDHPGHIQFDAPDWPTALARARESWPGLEIRPVPPGSRLKDQKGSDGRPKTLPETIEAEKRGPGRPPVDPDAGPVPWRVWDDVRGVELPEVRSASLEGARKKARRAHPGLRKVRVEPIAAAP